MESPNHHPAGFYYHYKHDPVGAFNNYAYFIVAPGHHTEAEVSPPPPVINFQTYLPLYDSALVYRMGKFADVRPLEMAMENVEYKGATVPRFKRIEDPDLIARLKTLRNEMYPEIFG